MELCESCARELAPAWKFCIYCGRPVRQTTVTAASHIPAAIRQPQPEQRASRYDAPYWIGVAMGVLGLGLIIYAAVQIYGSYA